MTRGEDSTGVHDAGMSIEAARAKRPLSRRRALPSFRIKRNRRKIVQPNGCALRLLGIFLLSIKFVIRRQLVRMGVL